MASSRGSRGLSRGRMSFNSKPKDRERLGPYHHSSLISLDDSPLPENLVIPQPAPVYTCFGIPSGPEAEERSAARARERDLTHSEGIKPVAGALGGGGGMEEKMRSSLILNDVAGSHQSQLLRLRTPLAMLHDLCSQGSAKIYFPVEEEIPGTSQKPGGLLFRFRCDILVVTQFKDTYSGSGLGTSKKNARQAAARDLLMNMTPKISAQLTPECEGQMAGAGPIGGGGGRSSIHISGLQEGSRQVQQRTESTESVISEEDQVDFGGMVPYHHGGVGSVGEEPEEEENDREGEVQVTTTVEGEITITLRLPQFMTATKQQADQGVQTQTENLLKEVAAPAPAKKLSLIDQVKTVQGWVGPKILKLKGSKVHEIKDPIKVIGIITAEQKLKMDFITLSEENGGDDGLTKYTCLLEVYPLSDLEQPALHFTEFGTGDSPVDAQQAAARKFLVMIRMILNSS